MNKSPKELFESIRNASFVFGRRARSLAAEAWADAKTDYLVMTRLAFGVLIATLLISMLVGMFVDARISKKHQEEQSQIVAEKTLLQKANSESVKQQAQIKDLTAQVSALTQGQAILKKTPNDETDIHAVGVDIRLHKNSGVSVVIVAPQQPDNSPQAEIK